MDGLSLDHRAGKAPNRPWRRGGRPPLPAEQRRTLTAEVALSPREMAELRRKAAAARLSVAELMRRAALGRQIAVPPTVENARVVAELGRLGNLINQSLRAIHTGKAHGLPVEELRALRRELADLRDDLLGGR